ncbi:MAG: aminoglycoside phosphotransferase family protein [Polyangiaceae bacterium]|nr:aminoglycoside phosphotransferase family protein [Polyangiaceae bacterium]
MAELRARPSAWRPAALALLETLGRTEVEVSDLGGSNLVLSVGDAEVLKLAPPIYAAPLAIEAEALRALEPFSSASGGSSPCAIPKVLASGTFQEWSYLWMTRLPGAPILRPQALGERDLACVARAAGAWLAALHDQPVKVFEHVPDWRAYLERHVPGAASRQARWGVPHAIVAEMRARLEHLDLDAVTSGAHALLHADLHEQNILVDARVRLTGVVDFADATVGDPLFDLVTPALLIGRGRKTVVRALFDGYGSTRLSKIADPVARLVDYAILHPFNDLTRILRWTGQSAETLDDLARLMFPLD